MNNRYAETFSRHRVLLSIPVVVAVVVAAWYVIATPPSYESKAAVWVDNPPTQISSIYDTNTSLLPPAAQVQSFLNELLTTRSFRLKIGRVSPLGAYVASRKGGWSPGSVLERLRGAGSLDDRIVAALGPGNVKTVVAGPQLLAVNLTAGDPTVAAKALKTLVNELTRERNGVIISRAQANLAFYESHVEAATHAVDSARAARAAYLAQHPDANSADPELRTLTQAEQNAVTTMTKATAAKTQAATAAATAQHVSDGHSLRLIDPPSVPTAPTSGAKNTAFAIVGGLFAGLLVSLLGLVALTAKNRPLRSGWQDDLDLQPRYVALMPAPERYALPPSVADGAVEADADDEEVLDDEVDVQEAVLADGHVGNGKVVCEHCGQDGDLRDVHEGGRIVVECRDQAACTERSVTKAHAAQALYAQHPSQVLRGTIIDVHDEGVGRKTRPVWTIQSNGDAATALAPGRRVVQSGEPSREGLLRTITETDDGRLLFEVEITAGKLGTKGAVGRAALRAGDARWAGAKVELSARDFRSTKTTASRAT